MRTMSSGSSGHSVTVPEPLSSTLFLTKRMVGYVSWWYLGVCCMNL